MFTNSFVFDFRVSRLSCVCDSTSSKKALITSIVSKLSSVDTSYQKNHFTTDTHINGEFFRSKTNNQYFCVVNKDTKVGELSRFTGDFRSLENAIKIRNYNPETDVILRLEFTKNKSYFVESYQAISIDNPDVTVMNMPFEELLKSTPDFEPLPHG